MMKNVFLVVLIIITSSFRLNAQASKPSATETIGWLRNKFDRYAVKNIELVHYKQEILDFLPVQDAYQVVLSSFKMSNINEEFSSDCTHDRTYKVIFYDTYLTILEDGNYSISDDCRSCKKYKFGAFSSSFTIPYSAITRIETYERVDKSWYWVKLKSRWLRFYTYGKDINQKYQENGVKTENQQSDFSIPFDFSETNIFSRIQNAFTRLNDLFPRTKETF